MFTNHDIGAHMGQRNVHSFGELTFLLLFCVLRVYHVVTGSSVPRCCFSFFQNLCSVGVHIDEQYFWSTKQLHK